MEDRYEIRGRLGQGGVGTVYRAFDKRMSREVAIKRIIAEGGPELQKEAARQLEKEAASLASLQHPNVVTVYDVGGDEDGPFVVMELITGKTLDELIQDAPLTLPDFKELALQTQEGLIAAQELGLVHRDLKPGNVMLNWLPSGKFQVKLVDFGLAKLSPKPSLQTLDHTDSIFGSIFFMAPEQFERVALDARVDMYSIGCVYYHALTGEYPFGGETGPQVMASHLNHSVIPLDQVRPDLPRWICDWIMWHINRHPADRPEDARNALQIFLQNDNAPPPPAIPVPPSPAPSKTSPGPPTLKRPGMNSQPTARIRTAPVEPDPDPQPKTQSIPKPLMPPEGFKPSVHTSSVYVGDILPPPEVPIVPVPPVAPSGVAKTPTGPLKPVPTGPVKSPATPIKPSPTQRAASPTARTSPGPIPGGPRSTYVPPPPPPKKGLKQNDKVALWIAAVLIAGFVAFLLYKLG